MRIDESLFNPFISRIYETNQKKDSIQERQNIPGKSDSVSISAEGFALARQLQVESHTGSSSDPEQEEKMKEEQKKNLFAMQGDKENKGDESSGSDASDAVVPITFAEYLYNHANKSDGNTGSDAGDEAAAKSKALKDEFTKHLYTSDGVSRDPQVSASGSVSAQIEALEKQLQTLQNQLVKIEKPTMPGEAKGGESESIHQQIETVNSQIAALKANTGTGTESDTGTEGKV